MFRREAADLFQRGAYRPLPVHGPRKRHVLAFARRMGEQWAVVAAPRLPAGLTPQGGWPLGETVWSDTRIQLPSGAPSRYRDALTGGEVRADGGLSLADGLRHFPALLLRADAVHPGKAGG